MKLHTVLINHNRLALPEANLRGEPSQDRSVEAVGTLLANMAYYGYAPSATVIDHMRRLSADKLGQFWQDVKPSFESITGADRKMEKFVVYKNFPQEVLQKTEAEYWISQICMYIGFPNEIFTEDEVARAPLNEKLKLKVLDLAREDENDHIFTELVKAKARWSDTPRAEAIFLISLKNLETNSYDLGSFGFKENGITLIKNTLDNPKVKWTILDATDILRLAAAMSDVEDISLRGEVKFRKFKRAERKAMLYLLEHAKNLEGDFAMRPILWKYLLSMLHPGDYKFARVQKAYDALYNDKVETFNSQVEQGILNADVKVLDLLVTRPGELVRRYAKLAEVFGDRAVDALSQVTPKLSTIQMVKLQKYLTSVNTRTNFIYRPKGSWKKSKVMPNAHAISNNVRVASIGTLDLALKDRMAELMPEGVMLSIDTHDVKLATNDSKLASYGTGTVFRIPDNITFLRTASYWKKLSRGNVWYDVGWNFFDSEWKPVGYCCWNSYSFPSNGYSWYHSRNEKPSADTGAIFSGDPTNSKEMQGRACQMIDLYLDGLKKAGVRYAIWSVLAYNNIPFSEAEDVFASIQWGEKPTEGKLFEPSRAQMSFPLTSNAKNSYVAMIDVEKRELVYLDVDFGGAISSAGANSKMLSEKMPAFIEHLDTLPSVADVFINAPEGNIPVVYSDDGLEIEAGQTAYVFRPENPNNSFVPLKVEEFL